MLLSWWARRTVLALKGIIKITNLNDDTTEKKEKKISHGISKERDNFRLIEPY